MICTDFDGTLKPGGKPVPRRTRREMARLRKAGVKITVATGRSLYSFHRARGHRLPADYLAFSSGAGIWDLNRRRLIHSESLTAEETAPLIRALKDLDTDFCVQAPAPETHRFACHASTRPGADFSRRRALYRNFLRPLESEDLNSPASQIIVFSDPENRISEPLLREIAKGLSVVRTTSPLDGETIWWEIFPRTVGKASACTRICGLEAIDPDEVLALGNDYNDLDLLDWAGTAFLCENGPDELKARFPRVPGPEDSGLIRAAALWTRKPGGKETRR